MLLKSSVWSQASGSIGGTTYSHNRFGMYARNRTIPVDPATDLQQTIRGAMATAADLWLNTLTADQRAGWEVYAAQTPWYNKLGDLVHLIGLNQFHRQAVPSLQAGIAPIQSYPAEFTYPTADINTLFGVDATDDQVDVTVVDGDAWLSEDDAHMLVYMSPGQNPDRAFYKGPYNYAGKIDGDSVTPPTGVQNIDLPFAVTPNQRVHGYYLLRRADGRISIRRRFQAIAA